MGRHRPGPNEFATQAAIFRMRDQYLTKAARGTNSLILTSRGNVRGADPLPVFVIWPDDVNTVVIVR